MKSYGKAMMAVAMMAVGIILAAPAAPAGGPQTPEQIVDAAVAAIDAAYEAAVVRVSDDTGMALETLAGPNAGDIPAAKRCKIMGDAFARITKDCASAGSKLQRLVTQAEARLNRIGADSSHIVAVFQAYGDAQGDLNSLRTTAQDVIYTELGQAFGFLP